MSEKKVFSEEQAKSVGAQIGIDWEHAPFDVEQFRGHELVDGGMDDAEDRRDGKRHDNHRENRTGAPE